MSAESGSFSWGVAATGTIAEQVGAIITRQPGMSIAAVGSRDLARAESLASKLGAPAAYGSYAELVGDPAVQAVYVATPHAQHRSVAELAIAAGKAVLCEKPLTASLAETDALVAQARAAKVFLMEGMWMWFNPLIQKARSIIDSGALGEVRTIEATFGFPQPYDPTHRLWDPQRGGGALLDLGIYPVALAYLLLGEPTSTTVTGTLSANDLDAHAELHMTWPNGAEADLRTSLTQWLPMRGRIVCSAGEIVIAPPFHAATRITVLRDGRKEQHLIDSSDAAFVAQAYEVRDRVLQGHTESATVPLEASLALMRILEDARRAIGACAFV
ncbi:Gfo/Idh/MocA family protein [Streptodolium elevatio]